MAPGIHLARSAATARRGPVPAGPERTTDIVENLPSPHCGPGRHVPGVVATPQPPGQGGRAAECGQAASGSARWSGLAASRPRRTLAGALDARGSALGRPEPPGSRRPGCQPLAAASVKGCGPFKIRADRGRRFRIARRDRVSGVVLDPPARLPEARKLDASRASRGSGARGLGGSDRLGREQEGHLEERRRGPARSNSDNSR